MFPQPPQVMEIAATANMDWVTSAQSTGCNGDFTIAATEYNDVEDPKLRTASAILNAAAVIGGVVVHNEWRQPCRKAVVYVESHDVTLHVLAVGEKSRMIMANAAMIKDDEEAREELEKFFSGFLPR